MSIQWTLTAGFLYCEVFILIILTLPILSAKTWYWIFKMRVFYLFDSWRNITFGSLSIYLIIMCVDSAMSMFRAMNEKGAAHSSIPGSEAMINSKLFRAQRNFYISGFAILLAIVIRRMILVYSTQAQLETNIETLTKQARNAAEFQAQQDRDRVPDAEVAELKGQLSQRNSELEERGIELERKNADLVAMQKQAEGVAQEYDRLAAEVQRMQKTESPNKKDD